MPTSIQSTNEMQFFKQHNIRFEYDSKNHRGIIIQNAHRYEVKVIKFAKNMELTEEQGLYIAKKTATILLKKNLFAVDKELNVKINKTGVTNLTDNKQFSHDEPEKTRKDYSSLAKYLMDNSEEEDDLDMEFHALPMNEGHKNQKRKGVKKLNPFRTQYLPHWLAGKGLDLDCLQA